MTRRTQKVEELIRQELSKLIQSELGEVYGIICVNRVYVTSDLKSADIYMSVIPSENKIELVKALNKNKGFYNKSLASKLTLRYTPQVLFKLDESSDEVDRVEELLEKIDHGA